MVVDVLDDVQRGDECVDGGVKFCHFLIKLFIVPLFGTCVLYLCIRNKKQKEYEKHRVQFQCFKFNDFFRSIIKRIAQHD